MSAVATWLYARGHAIDLILGVLLVEAIWLVRWRGWTPGAAVLCLLPGAALLLAVRAALVGLSWPWVALALALSFPAHLADVLSRAPRGRARRQPRERRRRGARPATASDHGMVRNWP